MEFISSRWKQKKSMLCILQGYRATGLQGYRATGLKDYRATGLQGYRATGLQGYRLHCAFIIFLSLYCNKGMQGGGGGGAVRLS